MRLRVHRTIVSQLQGMDAAACTDDCNADAQVQHLSASVALVSARCDQHQTRLAHLRIAHERLQAAHDALRQQVFNTAKSMTTTAVKNSTNERFAALMRARRLAFEVAVNRAPVTPPEHRLRAAKQSCSSTTAMASVLAEHSASSVLCGSSPPSALPEVPQTCCVQKWDGRAPAAGSVHAEQKVTSSARVEWWESLPLERQAEVHAVPCDIKLRSLCRRRQVNLGIQGTQWLDKPPNDPVWRCKVNVHALEALHVHPTHVHVPQREAGCRATRSVTSPHLFTLLLQVDFLRLKGNDMPPGVHPQWALGERPLDVAQRSKSYPQPTPARLPMSWVPEEAASASSSWVTYTSAQLWDAFLEHTGRVVAPISLQPPREVRWEVLWHGPEPCFMERATQQMGVVCTKQNWRDVYAVAVQLSPVHVRRAAHADCEDAFAHCDRGMATDSGVPIACAGAAAALARSGSVSAAGNERTSIRSPAPAPASGTQYGGHKRPLDAV